MQRRFTTILSSVTVVLVLTVGFQNCGKSAGHVEHPSVTKTDFFGYPYSESPKFYGEVLLLKPAGAIANLNEFQFIGTVAYPSNSTASVAYEVRIQTGGGATLCPTQTGTLAPGFTSIVFNCVTVIDSGEARVELKVTAGGEEQIFEKFFQ